MANGSVIKGMEEGRGKGEEQEEEEEEAVPLEDLQVKVKAISGGNSSSKRHSNKGVCSFLTGHRLTALLAKNFIRMWRNIGFLIFQVCLRCGKAFVAL